MDYSWPLRRERICLPLRLTPPFSVLKNEKKTMNKGSAFAFLLALGCTTQALALDPSGQRYVDQLVQGGPVSIRDAAQSIYHSGYREQEVLDVAAEVLLRNYRTATDNTTSDAMAWLCKALGNSGNGRYKPVLNEVVSNANNRRLDRHCSGAARGLPDSGAGYRAGMVNLDAYRRGQGRPAASAPASRPAATAPSSQSAANFDLVRVGMSKDEVDSMLGVPSATYSHQTGKAWIPFNFKGKDVARIVALYKGKGRIIFSQESVYSSVWRVLEIHPNPNETGYP